VSGWVGGYSRAMRASAFIPEHQQVHQLCGHVHGMLPEKIVLHLLLSAAATWQQPGCGLVHPMQIAHH
jgi:hypothetical protein